MKDIVVIGAGDSAREAVWAAERINLQSNMWNILGFVDDEKAGAVVDGYPVLGTVEWLRDYQRTIYATCAIGSGKTRARVWTRLQDCGHIRPATLIDPAALIGRGCAVGEGSILCAGTVLTIGVKIGFNCIVNINCTVGHDAVLEAYCTAHPGCNLSGKIHVGACTDMGTGTKIIQGISVASGTVLGAGAVVCRDITQAGTYVGVPAKRLEKPGR